MARQIGKKTMFMHSNSAYRCKIPTSEAITAMNDLSTGAYKLLIYYYCKSTGWELRDKEVAETIGVTERRLTELKKELTDKKYLYEINGEIRNIFVGREAVMAWQNPTQED